MLPKLSIPLLVVLGVGALVAGCDGGRSPTPLSQDPGPTPVTPAAADATLTPSGGQGNVALATSTSTAESCDGLSWAARPAPPELVARARTDMASASPGGNVKVSLYGEEDGCGQFTASQIDFGFTLDVRDSTTEAEVTAFDQRVHDIAAQLVPAGAVPGLGRVVVSLRKDGQPCTWDHDKHLCQPLTR